MSQVDRDNFFSKHLFGVGIECPTKLYYYAKDYPESRQARPFIEHAIYNKKLLKALLRSIYPEGIYVDEDSVWEAAQETSRLLESPNTAIFNAIFEHHQMMGRLPVVVKSDRKLTVFHVQTKAFDSRKHRLCNAQGRIYSKWRRYLLDFSYQVFLIKKQYPDFDIEPILVLPEKSGLAYTDNMPFLLKPLERNAYPDTISRANQELLVKLDVSELITEILESSAFAKQYLPKDTFEDAINYLRGLYFNQKREPPQVGLKCKNCEFRIEKERYKGGKTSGFVECWTPEMDKKDLLNNHVFDLIGSGTAHYMHHQIFNQREVPDEELSSLDSILEEKGPLTQPIRQSLQVFKARGEDIPREIIRPQLFRELARWEFPLHFLDFEAGNYAVPVRANQPPYHLIIFQFSCHTLYKDGSWVHHQWIDDFSGKYASYEVVRQLMNIPDILQGTIVQYSDFERNALKSIRRELMNEERAVTDSKELITWIEEIINRKDSTTEQSPYMVDLSRQVRNFYYNREMADSLSIKDVLKSIMSLSEALKKMYSQPYSSENFTNIQWWQSNGGGGARNPYNILVESGDSPIHRGTEAMVVYGKLIAQDIREEQLQAYQKALLKYCELDTLAMMMIYQHWQQKMLDKV